MYFKKGGTPIAVFKVEKNAELYRQSNHHLRDKSRSLKVKGLLSLMLSLPEDWNSTTKGLARICAAVRDRERECRAEVRWPASNIPFWSGPRKPKPPKRKNPIQAENTGAALKRAFLKQ